jgi:hypothetical protein
MPYFLVTNSQSLSETDMDIWLVSNYLDTIICKYLTHSLSKAAILNYARIYRPSFREKKPNMLVFNVKSEHIRLVLAKTGSVPIFGHCCPAYKRF